jgi:pyruvate dehydrogenase E1 component alpha subunit
MDFFDVYEKAGDAIERARRGDGPTLLECKTYRYFGHYQGDAMTYRSKQEVEDWRQKRDPLDHFEAHVTEAGLVPADDLRRIDAEVIEALQAAVTAAEAAPQPNPDDVLTDVYVSA